jgi:phosphocarrier protein
VTVGRVVERRFVVRSELGLHARPAGRFARLASRFESDIQVARNGEWVAGTSVLSLLSLAAGPGTSLLIRAVGADADQAVEALGRLVEEAGDEPAPV